MSMDNAMVHKTSIAGGLSLLLAVASATVLAFDNTVSNEFWDTRQYVNAQSVATPAAPSSVFDSRQTSERASETAPRPFSTLVPGTLLFIL